MTATAYIGLGSNLGDRQGYLDRAVQMLGAEPGIRVLRISRVRETAAVGGPAEQGPYLNAAAELATELEPIALLHVLQRIESQLGRVRTVRWGPRTLDLDLLLFDDLIIRGDELTIPHPRLHERAFVLEPLAELVPQLIHPILKKNMEELRRELAQTPSPAQVGRELLGQCALVTGSTSGIGRAIALELARAGADVLVHRRLPRANEGAADLFQAKADETATGLREQGVRAEAILADLREPDECRRLADIAWGKWGGLDIWVNNAGADTLTGSAARHPFEQKLEELWKIDVRATILLGRDVGARMAQAGNGVILNLGWDQADTGMEGDSGQLFGAVKAAVHAFTKSLALSLAPHVRVNCLAPGWIKTAWGQTASAPWQERVLRETPLGRWGLPEDVALAARWLASPAAAFVTGQIIRVNGGGVR